MMAKSDVGRRNGCLLPFLLVMVGLMVLGMVVAITVWARSASAQAKVQLRLEELEARGIPIDSSSMQSRYEAETTVAGAAEWLALLEYLSSKDFGTESAALPILGQGKEIPTSGSWDDEEWVRAFLAKHEKEYVELQRLCDDDTPFRTLSSFDSYSTLLPEVQNSRQATRFASLYGEVALRDKDGEGLWRAIQVQRTVARKLRASPFMVSALVQIAIDGISIGLVKKGLEADVWTGKVLQAVRDEMMSGVAMDDRWTRAIVGERASFLEACKDPKQFQAMPRVPWGVGSSHDVMLFLEYMDRAERMETLDLNVFFRQSKEWEDLLKKEEQRGFLTQLETMRARQTIPALSQVATAFIRDVMSHRIAVLGCAIRQWEDKHGRMPDSLESLTEVGIDVRTYPPVGDKPFGYQASPEGILWGFEPRLEGSTPVLPPDENASAENAMWVWRF